MELILNKILNNIELVSAVIVALATLIALLVTKYKEIRRLIAQNEFDKIAATFIAENEYSPVGLMEKLITPPIPKSPHLANSNSGKALIAAQATIEQAKKTKPSILKRLGIKSATDAVPLVGALYQNLLKPVVKSLKK